MKKLIYYIAILVLLELGVSCGKNNSTPTGGASLTVINSVVGSDALITNFSNDYALSNFYARANMLYYGSYNSSSNEFGLKSGSIPLALYQLPDTTSKSTPVYKLQLNMAIGSIHTLFLTGQISSPDTLFTTDNPPYHPSSDSSVGVRFVNLSPGSNPVNITLSTSPNVNEFSGITYKSITSFKSYPATAGIKSYKFQFWDATTGTLLGGYTINGVNNGSVNSNKNIYRYHNVTFVLEGMPGSTDVLLINNQ